MLTSELIQQLNQLQLGGMAEQLTQLCAHPDNHSLSLADGLSLLISSEQAHRQNRRQLRLLKTAKLRFPQACLEQVDYRQPRELDKQQFLSLAQCHWIQQARNLVIIGATGLGKSFLACALAHQACRRGLSALYFRVPKLLEALRLAHASGSFPRFLQSLAKAHLLILDDWGLDQLNRSQRHDLFEIIEDRYQLSATLLVTQTPIELWHHYIDDNTLADAILDRLLPRADKIILKGDSMRSIIDSS